MVVLFILIIGIGLITISNCSLAGGQPLTLISLYMVYVPAVLAAKSTSPGITSGVTNFNKLELEVKIPAVPALMYVGFGFASFWQYTV